MMNIQRILPISIALFIIILVTVSFSLPKFTAKAEQKCSLCHVNPTGGGMRNSYGSQFFALTELATHKVPFEDISKFQPQVSEILSLGFDMRTQYLYNELNQTSTFFQMEGNFYLSAQLSKNFSVSFSKDLYNSFGIYGMGYVLPYNGYFKVGKFQPAFGWRFADHTSFVREKMRWSVNSTDTGIEIGLFPYNMSFNLGLFNGNEGMFDNDNNKAVSSRLEFRKNIANIGLGLGGSYYLNDTDNGDILMYGIFAYVNLLKGRIIYLGELAQLKENTLVSFDVESLAATHTLSYYHQPSYLLNLIEYSFSNLYLDIRYSNRNFVIVSIV